jgi:hypothetical protein
MDITTVIGTLGAATVLLGFIMIQERKWSIDSMSYSICNIIGSVLLIVYAVLLRSYPFIALNTIWVLVAFKNIAGFIFSKKSR